VIGKLPLFLIIISYYNKYDNDDTYNNDDINNDNPYKNNEELINKLEDALSDLTDNEYINNNIYHLFPVVVFTIVTNLLVSSFIALS
jgi:hemerythrin superfamily protein